MSYIRHDKNNNPVDPQPGSTDASDLGGNSGWTEVSYKNFNADYEAHDYLNQDRTPGTYQARNFDNTPRTPAEYQRHDQFNLPISSSSLSLLEYTTVASTSSFTLRSIGTVNYEVDWGDGTTESLTTNNPTHAYSSAGEYTIKITPAEGSTYRPYFNNAVSDTSIASVSGAGGSQLGTSLRDAWEGATNMTSFSSDVDTSSVTYFRGAWMFCSGLTSFPLIDTSSGINFQNVWSVCSGLTSFPLINTSSGTEFSDTWNSCSSLTSFPLIDTSSGNNFTSAWKNCSSLTSFPALDFSSGTNFSATWFNCDSLTSFPANMFDTTGTLLSYSFSLAWADCALSAQSIENILVSLDTNGASNISLGINGGTNAAKTTWSAAANTAYTNLINKGWTISYNS